VAVIALVVVSTFLSRMLMVAAISRIGSGQMALLTPVETLLTITWSMLFLGERLAPLQLVGGALILVSALLAIQRLGRARVRSAVDETRTS
jgi:drug/metabolite transporter (DMT)-like permease